MQHVHTKLALAGVLWLLVGCAPVGPYQDGLWKAEVPADAEGYSTSMVLRVEGGRIAQVDWTILDTGRQRPFDGTYFEVYSEPLYRQQSVDDWKGAQTYGPALVATQDLTKVDGVAAATWTYRKFQTVAGLALAQARR